MSNDWFGIDDTVRDIVPPPGMEDVHNDGMTWARQGDGPGDTSRMSANQLNQIIGNFRALLKTPEIDLSDLATNDVTLLREVVIRWSAAKVVELLPATVIADRPNLVNDLADDPAFIAAAVAAVPQNLSADNLTAGTVPDTRLPARIGAYGQTVTDLNDAFDSGWYAASPTAANSPTGTWLMGQTIRYTDGKWATQTFHEFIADSSSNTKTWRREYNNEAWGSWYQVRLSEAELDARYLRLTGGIVTGWLSATNLVAMNGGLYVNANSATSNSHLWFRDETETNRALAYWSRAGNKIRFQVYDAAGAPIGSNFSWDGSDLYAGVDLVRDAGNTPDGSPALAAAGTDTTKRAWSASDLAAIAGGPPDAVIEEQYASGTSLASVAGTWNVRSFNVEQFDPDGLVSLSGGQFTPTAPCRIFFSATGYNCGHHRAAIYNVTDGVYVRRATSQYAHNAYSGMNASSAWATLQTGKAYAVHHYTAVAHASGLGFANSLPGISEVFSQAALWRT